MGGIICIYSKATQSTLQLGGGSRGKDGRGGGDLTTYEPPVGSAKNTGCSWVGIPINVR